MALKKYLVNILCWGIILFFSIEGGGCKKSEPKSEPKMEDANVYFASKDTLLAVNASTGVLKWKFVTNGRIANDPTVFDSLIICVSFSGGTSYIYALDRFKGISKWTYTARNMNIQAIPTIFNKSIYFGNAYANSNFFALESTTGVLVFNVLLSDGIVSSPLIANGFIYLLTLKNLYQLYTINGTTNFFTPMASVASSPAFNNNSLYFCSNADKSLHRFDISSKMNKWTFNNNGVFYTEGSCMSPTIYNGLVYFGDLNGRFYAVDTAGNKKWEFNAGSQIYTSPTVYNGLVYFGDLNGKFYAMDAVSGNKKWEFVTGDAIYASPVAYNGLVYFGDKSGRFHAVNAADGSKKWEFVTGEINYGACIATDGGKVIHSSVSGDQQ